MDRKRLASSHLERKRADFKQWQANRLRCFIRFWERSKGIFLSHLGGDRAASFPASAAPLAPYCPGRGVDPPPREASSASCRCPGQGGGWVLQRTEKEGTKTSCLTKLIAHEMIKDAERNKEKQLWGSNTPVRRIPQASLLPSPWSLGLTVKTVLHAFSSSSRWPPSPLPQQSQRFLSLSKVKCA